MSDEFKNKSRMRGVCPLHAHAIEDAYEDGCDDWAYWNPRVPRNDAECVAPRGRCYDCEHYR